MLPDRPGIPMNLIFVLNTSVYSQSPVEYGWRLLLGGLVMLAIGAWGVSRTRAFWSGRLRNVGATWRVFGPEWGHVGQSLTPYAFYVGSLLGLSVTVGYVADSTTGSASSLASMIMEILIALALVGALGIVSIILFNRPRFLVPPYAREFPGIVAYWSRRIRTGSRSNRDKDSS